MNSQSGTHDGQVNWREVTRQRRYRRAKNLAALGLVLLGPVLAVVTYLGLGPLELNPSSSGIRLILLADLVYVLTVAALVAQRVAKIIASRRANSAGSQLHLRLTRVFALVALVPTVLVAVFAVITVNFALEGWFSERVRNVVGNSLAAAQAYKQEQTDDLSEDAIRLAGYLNVAKEVTNFIADSDLRLVLTQAQEQVQRGLKEAFVVDGAGELKSRGNRSYRFDFEPITLTDLEKAQLGHVVVIEDWPNNEFRALYRLQAFADRYIYISRTVDGEILSLLDETRATVNLYQQLEADRGKRLFEFGLIYLGFALILILAAIWLGLWFAERLARPVGQLANAAARVGDGDLDVQVVEANTGDEIALLGRHFNTMTRQLKAQRETLLSNTDQIERRRRLFDSVLSSVTAGVIGLDAGGRVTFLNRSAQRLLNIEGDQLGAKLAEVAGEFEPLLEEMSLRGTDSAQETIRITRRGQMESLLVRIATRTSEDGTLEGYVLAFDDVSELVSAQKMAAWGDVARRIAHEIKNPLTPIRLSAQRIKRKFSPMAGDELEALEQYTDVIVRQTEGLTRIVDEFSRFARMPEPELRETDLMSLVRDAVTLQSSGQPGVDVSLTADRKSIACDLDKTMIGQALTNLVKNAGEAIESYKEQGAHDDHKPEIRIAVVTNDKDVEITISDNGVGLPEDRTRLFEPYVTTRSEGTGLGLPIVKKIIEEHGGSLVLRDAGPFDDTEHLGAMAVIRLPRLASLKRKNVA